MSHGKIWVLYALFIVSMIQFSIQKNDNRIGTKSDQHGKGDHNGKGDHDAKGDHKEDSKKDKENENYRVQYETKFAFQNVDEFGLKVKYNKTEHVFYGDNPPPNKTANGHDHPSGGADHGHDDHGHVDQGHGDHGYGDHGHGDHGHADVNTDHPGRRLAGAQNLVTLQDYFAKEGISSQMRKKNSFVLPYKDKDEKWKNLEFKYSEMCLKPKKCRSKRDMTFVTYYLHTKKNPEDPFHINSFDDFPIKSSSFNPNHTTIFLIHGWLGNIENSPINTEVRKAFLESGNYNIMVVDWSAAAADLDYPGRVIPDSIIVGTKVAKFIKSMIDAGYTKHRTLKLVGHDVGAHVAGVIARKIPGKIYSVVGLDPSIGFKKEDVSIPLAKEIAAFVEVIHTSSIGLDFPMGHVDFFVNGGETQPGCQFLDSISLGSCSHAKVCDYYASTIKNPKQFQAVPCRSMNDVRDRTCFSASYDKFYMGGAEPNRLMDGIFSVRTSGHRMLPL